MFSDKNLCDTPYTSWNPNDSGNIGQMEIPMIIKEYEKNKSHDVVITGGEPGMYPEELKLLCDELRKLNPKVFITIETNGTYLGDFYNSFNLISLSPKLSSSVPHNTEHEKMHEKNRLNFETLEFIHNSHLEKKCDVQWKFVFSSQEDVNEIKSLQRQISFSDSDVYLMPEGVSREDLELNRMKTVKAAVENNWNYSDRLHIVIWGNKRGF